MKKKINIEKKLNFSQMISEVTAISLEHDLNFISEDNITGNLIISGKYKSNVASQIDEDFNYKIPVDISLTNHLDQDKSQVDITDFSYLNASRVQIKMIRKLYDNNDVEIENEEYKIIVSFGFSDLILPIEEMRINPLGFQITQYNISKVRAQKPVIQLNSNGNG